MSGELTQISVESEMKASYLDYAMSVIVGRALPDARDGLKPVHRRTLFAMKQLGNDWDKAYKKSARVVGDVIGKYHPHGDSAVYDTIVRMAQGFSLRYPLVNGQGNFGSIDGDSAAAMRYTEVRMQRITHSMLAELDKDTVDFVDNYDGTEQLPSVLPTKFPNLLVNGASGIAVGMATNIPPHNISDVISGCIAFLENEEITVEELMNYIPGPDFPTGGIMFGMDGLYQAYKHGRGKIYLRAKAHIEPMQNDRDRIVVTEIPYQVNKTRLMEKISELFKEGKIDGISALRDESDREGMRVVIECKRGASGDVILNRLYSLSQLQVTFGINMVALKDGQPFVASLKDLIKIFINHRREVVSRRSIYDRDRARDRLHIVDGLLIALENIEEVIKTIRAAKSSADAKTALMVTEWSVTLDNETQKRHFSPGQAQAILDMRLHRLTGLEQGKLFDERIALLEEVVELSSILNHSTKLNSVIKDELFQVLTYFGDPRRTEISQLRHDIDAEELIEKEDIVITMTRRGYVKAQPLSNYSVQQRGGRGKTATRLRDDDGTAKVIITNTHDTLLCFSTFGKVYKVKAYKVPSSGRLAKGVPLINLFPLADGESITEIIPVDLDAATDMYIFMALSDGTVKKVAVSDFANIRTNGIIAVSIQPGASLVGASITDGQKDVLLFSRYGKAVRFNELQVRAMGRNAMGVRGMRLAHGDEVASMVVGDRGKEILTVTENGFGKRTDVEAYPLKNRGGSGVIAIKTTERNGSVAAAAIVSGEDDVILITAYGVLIRIKASMISYISRNTAGVKLIDVGEGDFLTGVQVIPESLLVTLDDHAEELYEKHKAESFRASSALEK